MVTRGRLAATLATAIFLTLALAPSALASSASFTALPNPQLSGEPVNFSGSAKTSCSGSFFAQCDADTYEWDFGDGTTGTGKNVSHTYIKPGSYTVTMRGCYCHYVSQWASASQTITILPPDKSRKVTLTTPLSGAEQSETTPGDPDGTGFATLDFYPDAAQLCYRVSFANINAEPAMVGHIHKAPRGQTQFAPVVQMETTGSLSPQQGCRAMDPIDQGDVLAHPTQFYVQFHNLEYPEGVIRGQLGD
jgi:hypothetical protein